MFSMLGFIVLCIVAFKMVVGGLFGMAFIKGLKGTVFCGEGGRWMVLFVLGLGLTYYLATHAPFKVVSLM